MILYICVYEMMMLLWHLKWFFLLCQATPSIRSLIDMLYSFFSETFIAVCVSLSVYTTVKFFSPRHHPLSIVALSLMHPLCLAWWEEIMCWSSLSLRGSSVPWHWSIWWCLLSHKKAQRLHFVYTPSFTNNFYFSFSISSFAIFAIIIAKVVEILLEQIIRIKFSSTESLKIQVLMDKN